MEFKVGDKVRVIVDDHSVFKKGHEFVVDRVGVAGNVYDENNICILKHRVELVTPKQSKKQRITILEKLIEELKERVEALEQAEKQRYVVGVDVAKEKEEQAPEKPETLTYEGKQYKKVNREAKAGDVVVFEGLTDGHCHTYNGKPYLVYEDEVLGVLRYDNGKIKYNLVYGWSLCPNPDVYELVEQPKTPNQQRKEIIEKAKRFVKENSKGVHYNAPTSEDIRRSVDIYNLTVDFSRGDKLQFVEDKNKRTVFALIRFKNGERIFHKGIAKCSPTDVFNEHIGKAIALGRALGKDVSEFENAVKPTKVTIGTEVLLIHIRKTDVIEEERIYLANAGIESGDVRIINDTNAEYGGTQVIYKVALSDGLYVANYSTALLSDEVSNVTVINEISQSEDFLNKNQALRVAKYVKGFVIQYKLTVNSAKHEIIADYRGENNDTQTS